MSDLEKQTKMDTAYEINPVDDSSCSSQPDSNLLKSRFRLGPDTIRYHVIAFVGELFGTFMFLWCAYVIANIANHAVSLQEGSSHDSHPMQLLMISLGFGLSVMFSIWCFVGVSGGAFNPAVSLSLCLARAITPTRCGVMWIAQIIGAMAAGGAASGMTPGPVKFDNALGMGCSRTRALFLEIFATAILCLTVLMTAVEKGESNFMCALPIGISLFIGNLALIAYSGAGINPARSLGSAVAKRYFPHYHWIYWIGPLLGAVLAWFIWQVLHWLDYANYVAREKELAESAKN
ncbi:Aquaporin-1 [Nakaseomyces bracarensis]|uniref:Aquaporin-1 n=1 Tax=Nakaseomyces bracarensis TaxID=273131 RepID=A0ABR4NNP3_9SACH